MKKVSSNTVSIPLPWWKERRRNNSNDFDSLLLMSVLSTPLSQRSFFLLPGNLRLISLCQAEIRGAKLPQPFSQASFGERKPLNSANEAAALPVETIAEQKIQFYNTH